MVREHSRHILLFGGLEDPDHDAVMRIGSESSEAADPFWGTACEAMQRTGTPPPRTVIGDPSQADGVGQNLYGAFFVKEFQEAQPIFLPSFLCSI